MTASEPPIPKHGGYRKLKSFQVAQLSQKGQLGEVETRVHRQDCKLYVGSKLH